MIQDLIDLITIPNSFSDRTLHEISNMLSDIHVEFGVFLDKEFTVPQIKQAIKTYYFAINNCKSFDVDKLSHLIELMICNCPDESCLELLPNLATRHLTDFTIFQLRMCFNI